MPLGILGTVGLCQLSDPIFSISASCLVTQETSRRLAEPNVKAGKFLGDSQTALTKPGPGFSGSLRSPHRRRA